MYIHVKDIETLECYFQHKRMCNFSCSNTNFVPSKLLLNLQHLYQVLRLSYRIVRVSYRIVRESYPIVRVSCSIVYHVKNNVAGTVRLNHR